jgi:DNA-binding MarR family transcriptional regulator
MSVADQRRVLVSLTRKSRELAARMAPQIDATYRRLEKCVGAEFSARLHDTLDYLLENLPPHESEDTNAAVR